MSHCPATAEVVRHVRASARTERTQADVAVYAETYIAAVHEAPQATTSPCEPCATAALTVLAGDAWSLLTILADRTAAV